MNEIIQKVLEIVNIPVVIICIVVVVGLVQILKNFLPKNLPAWAYAIATGVFSILVVLAAVYLPPIVLMILLVLCGSQLGYELVIQSVKKLVEHFVNGKIELPSVDLPASDVPPTSAPPVINRPTNIPSHSYS